MKKLTKKQLLKETNQKLFDQLEFPKDLPINKYYIEPDIFDTYGKDLSIYERSTGIFYKLTIPDWLYNYIQEIKTVAYKVGIEDGERDINRRIGEHILNEF